MHASFSLAEQEITFSNEYIKQKNHRAYANITSQSLCDPQ